MSRRNLVNVSMDNVQTIKTVIHQVRKPFHPRIDPCADFAREIEACKQKIWYCVENQEGNGVSQVQPKPDVIKSDTHKSGSLASPTKCNQHKGNAELQVYTLRVVELKQELKSRGLETNGLKKDLRARLLEAMLTDTNVHQGSLKDQYKSDPPVEEFEEKVSDEPKPERPVSKGHDDNKHSADAKMEQEEDVSKNNNSKFGHSSECDDGTTADSCGRVSKGSQASKEYWMNKTKPSPAKQVAESNKGEAAGRSPLRGVVKNAFKVFGSYGQSSTQMPSDRLDDPADDVSPPSSEASSCSKISGTKVRELVSKITNTPGYQSSQGGSGSALSKNLQAKKEARLARMAEIREKSKPLANNKVALTPKEYTSTLSSLNAAAASNTGKTKDLAAMRAQMREKAAASKLRKENIPANTNSQAASMSAGKRNLPSAQPDTVHDTLAATIKQTFVKKAKVSSPLETYEISDREDSETDDSDDSDDENRGQGKKIPSWASKQALYRALEQQYNGCVDGRKVDPDELFPEVQTCDLEAIFGNRKNARYKTRTSSANWKDDQVTMQEKLVYKRKMGFSTVQTSEI